MQEEIYKPILIDMLTRHQLLDEKLEYKLNLTFGNLTNNIDEIDVEYVTNTGNPNARHIVALIKIALMRWEKLYEGTYVNILGHQGEILEIGLMGGFTNPEFVHFFNRVLKTMDMIENFNKFGITSIVIMDYSTMKVKACYCCDWNNNKMFLLLLEKMR